MERVAVEVAMIVGHRRPARIYKDSGPLSKPLADRPPQQLQRRSSYGGLASKGHSFLFVLGDPVVSNDCSDANCPRNLTVSLQNARTNRQENGGKRASTDGAVPKPL